MGGVFFDSWALWEKMTFVLACAIVLTLGIGFVKVRYDGWRIRKYTALAASQKEAQTTEVSNNQVVDVEKQEIPFGIRALERGIEVEGVWVSRTNTPAPSIHDSPTPSLYGEPPYARPRSIRESDLLRLGHPRGRSRSRSPSRHRSILLDSRASMKRTVSVEALSHSAPNSPMSITSISADGTTTQMFLDHQRQRPTIMRNSTTLESLEGMQRIRVDSSTGASTADTEQILRNLAETKQDSGIAIPPDTRAKLLDIRADLDLLQTHRLSHVAETGQLTPRNRRFLTGDLQPSTPDGRKRDNAADYFSKTPEQSPQSSPILPPLDRKNNTFPSSDAESSPPATPTNEIMSSPTKPLLMPSSPLSDPPTSLDMDIPVLDAKFNDGPTPEPDTPPNFQANRNSQVLRRINSGFEILKPGTLPQLEALNLDALNGEEKRRSRRLQKKRPSSAGSYGASTFVDVV